MPASAVPAFDLRLILLGLWRQTKLPCALGALIPVAGPPLHLWTGAEVAAEAQRVLVVLSIAGMLGCCVNVFAFYLLASGRSRSNALISLVTAIFTLAASMVVLPYFGRPAAGWSACVGMVAQVFVTVILLRQSFSLAELWSRVARFVWLLPLGTGIVIALALRYLVGGDPLTLTPRWWYVVGSYALAVGIIFVIVVTVLRIGPYGATCWPDMRVIASLFLPAKVK